MHACTHIHHTTTTTKNTHSDWQVLCLQFCCRRNAVSPSCASAATAEGTLQIRCFLNLIPEAAHTHTHTHTHTQVTISMV